MQIKFEDLQISEPILRALNDMGFEEPTPIQREAIPAAKSGQDMIGQAQTGTGKTAAFGIPALEQVDPTIQDPQVLILSPTRELAIQVAEELNKMAQHTNIQALPIYGGQDIGRQFRMLKKHPQVIVATPGRLMDHMERKSISFDYVKVVILDEADEMLNMGFVDDINKILTAVPEERQTLLFSATMPKAIQELAETYLTEPTLIRMKPTQVTMDLIEQYYIEVQDRQKFDVLCRLLDIQAPELAIVFGRTGRAGKAGVAMTFVIPREIEHLHAIERLTKRKIARRKAPSLGEVLEGQQKIAVEKLIALADNREELASYRSSAEELLNDIDSVTLLAAALKLLTKEPDTTPVSITEEAPLRIRRRRDSGRRDGRRRDDRRRDGRRRDDRRDADRRRSSRDRSQRSNSGERRSRDGQKQQKHQGSGFKPYFKE